jgi:hypothetical protein
MPRIADFAPPTIGASAARGTFIALLNNDAEATRLLSALRQP